MISGELQITVPINGCEPAFIAPEDRGGIHPGSCEQDESSPSDQTKGQGLSTGLLPASVVPAVWELGRRGIEMVLGIIVCHGMFLLDMREKQGLKAKGICEEMLCHQWTHSFAPRIHWIRSSMALL